MRQFLIFLQKEFYHILRDWRTLFILIGMPIVQILIFGFALTNEVKNANMGILDLSHDKVTEQLAQRFQASRHFEVAQHYSRYDQIEAAFLHNDIKIALVFPEKFQENLLHSKETSVQIITDASDPNVGSTLATYASAILGDYQSELLEQTPLPYSIKPEIRMLYNPQLKGAPNFVPGVMSMVLMLICAMMTSIAIAREKELGTMEILLVSPIKPLMIIVSKTVPYLILSIVNFLTILLLSVFVLELPIAGSFWLLLMESILFIITALSLGLLISTIAPSQEIAMMVSLMGLMLPTIMFSGFMFPIENMPVLLQIITNIVPSHWYYYIVKAVMIKGLGLNAIWKETLILTGMTLFFLTISVRKFKVRLV